MRIEDLKKIVNNEGLKYANICLDRYYAPEEMVIKQIEGKMKQLRKQQQLGRRPIFLMMCLSTMTVVLR